MDPKYIAILGAGVIGAGALILMGQTPTSQAGGAFGGGESKKEVVTAEPTLTTETLTTEPLAPIYNIVMPPPEFPAIPQPAITEPWWVTSLEPPAPATTKKASRARAPRYLYKSPIAPSLVEPKPGVEDIPSQLPPNIAKLFNGSR